MSADPLCTTCGEPKSAHVRTAKGPYTHPREARGEGEYVVVSQGYTAGAMTPGEDDMYVPPRYKFVPTPPSAPDPPALLPERLA